MCADIFLRGAAPISSTLSFALLLLAVHEQEQEIIRQEILSAKESHASCKLRSDELSGSSSLQLPHDCLKQLHRMDAFLKETLRLYPHSSVLV